MILLILAVAVMVLVICSFFIVLMSGSRVVLGRIVWMIFILVIVLIIGIMMKGGWVFVVVIVIRLVRFCWVCRLLMWMFNWGLFIVDRVVVCVEFLLAGLMVFLRLMVMRFVFDFNVFLKCLGWLLGMNNRFWYGFKVFFLIGGVLV